jgi:hypothetical protein
MLTHLFKEKQSTELRQSDANKPEFEGSDGSIIETRCVPYPMELNLNRNDQSILSKNNTTFCENHDGESALGNSVGEIIEDLVEKVDIKS